MIASISSLKNTARLIGLLYFLGALAAIYGQMYVSPKIMVEGDIAASGKNLVANELLYRTRIAIDILGNISFVAVILLLYRLFSHVHERQAKFMAGLALVAIPVSFISESLDIVALEIFKGNLLKSFSPEHAQGMAETLLNIGSYSGKLISFHWGAWLIPLGLLIYKSGFIPRILGILVLINGVGYMIWSFTFILFPDAFTTVTKIVYPTWFIGEVPLILWLLIKGIKTKSETLQPQHK